MNDRRPRTILKHRFHIFTFIAVVMLAGVALIVPFTSVHSGSASTNGSGKAIGVTKTANNGARLTTSKSLEFSPAPLVFDETVSTFDGATCSIPQTDFNLGEVVCVKATGVPSSLFPWRVNWVGPYGLINESDAAVLDDNQEYRYTLPSTATEEINEQTVDHRGRWRVTLSKANGAIRQTAWFTVHEVGNPQADVLVEKLQRDSTDSIHVGDNAAFVVIVQNVGPDSATAVHLVDSVPAGATLVSFNQHLGPPCVTGGPSDCTIAAMANGDRAEFTVIYTIGGAPGPGQTSASVSSTSPDPKTENNSATANFAVATGTEGGGGACELTCPSDVTAFANTTEGGERGAHVNFDPAVGTGTCGTITATPASGSFFPVGTTVVTATSATGDGECHFTVTVEEESGNVSIICPASLEGNANASCEASFNLGNPTTAGDNVTVTVSRSDGKPMYDCDVNNENCVRKTTDLPFAAGVTTITWIAYSHSTPGPYASAEAEEEARTGSDSCTQTITVNDVTAPNIAATNQTVSADANCQAVIPDYSSTVSDNCACASSDTSEACNDHSRFTVTQTPAPGTVVGPGSHPVHIEANDGSSNNNGAGNTSTKDITFTVNDTTAPVITCPANISDVPTLPGTCSAIVVPGTATATDNCDSTPTITGTRSDGQPLVALYPKGTTTITWRATDDAGNYSECTQTITVVDNEAPVIVFNGQTPSMWPPNHKYQTFQVASFVSSVTDNCDSIGVSSVFITKVTSDEIENGNGDGNTMNDIVIAANCKSVQLRSEREGNGNGRVYTIFFKVVDSSGNAGTGTAKVVVPHNNGATPVDSGPHYTVMSTCP